MNRETFAARRQRLLAEIGHGALVLFSAPLAIRNNDVEHEYRQHSDFYYLTGFDEPESVLLLSTERKDAFTLFVRPRDPDREVWDGARAGVDGAVLDFGADAAYSIGELDEKLPGLLEGTRRLFYRLGESRADDERVIAALAGVRARARRGIEYPSEVVDPELSLHEMRRIKSEEEIEHISRAIDVTARGHIEAMRRARPGQYEYEVEAALSQAFRQAGAQRHAYSPIVGSGPNATVLHYRQNDRLMQDGDLLLIDAGCELDYYASDVTRTFPVSGRFDEPQRALYELVLAAQQASIDTVRPGATLEEVHQASVRVITAGLVDLGFFEGPVDEAVEKERYKPVFMHKTSHYLGMDVHDVGAYFSGGKPRPLEPGVVITVEPGVYVGAGVEAPEPYRGIGIRIEDDVVVTQNGCRVLSAAVPKSVQDIEAACAG